MRNRCPFSFKPTYQFDRALVDMTPLMRPFTAQDIAPIVRAFAVHNWPKPRELFEQYLMEQNTGDRLIWVTYRGEDIMGYVTLKWESAYASFRENKIPEIMDLNVLPPFRNRGVGSALIEIAEKAAFARGDVVGLGVGLYEGYGSAHTLYIERGYRPDGLGITHNYKRVAHGESVPLDDDLVLWFKKKEAEERNMKKYTLILIMLLLSLASPSWAKDEANKKVEHVALTSAGMVTSQQQEWIPFRTLVTGANRGLGLALTKKFLEEGHEVYATYRTPEDSQELLEIKNGRLKLIQVDFTQRGFAKKITAALEGKPLNLLVNNAGVFPFKCNKAPDLDEKDWHLAFQVNVVAPTQLSLALESNLAKAKDAKVVAISSRRASNVVCIEDEYPNRYGYRSTKAALNSAMVALAQNFAKHHISVVMIHPGQITTRMNNYDKKALSPAVGAHNVVTLIKKLSFSNTGEFYDAGTGEVISGEAINSPRIADQLERKARPK